MHGMSASFQPLSIYTYHPSASKFLPILPKTCPTSDMYLYICQDTSAISRNPYHKPKKLPMKLSKSCYYYFYHYYFYYLKTHIIQTASTTFFHYFILFLEGVGKILKLILIHSNLGGRSGGVNPTNFLNSKNNTTIYPVLPPCIRAR